MRRRIGSGIRRSRSRPKRSRCGRRNSLTRPPRRYPPGSRTGRSRTGPARPVCDRPGDRAGDRDRPWRDRQDRDGVPAAQGPGGRPDPGCGGRVSGDHGRGIVYLSRNGVHKVEYPTLVADLLRLLPADTARRLQRMYQDPQHSPAEMMLAVLEAFPAGEPVVALPENVARNIFRVRALHLAGVATSPWGGGLPRPQHFVVLALLLR